jgi:phosphatidylinositol glycan class C protein
MSNSRLLDPVDAFFGPAAMAQKRRDGARSSSRRRAKGHYKKLLWFKQPCMMTP